MLDVAVFENSLAARLVRDVGALISAGARAGRPIATFALDAEVRFATAADRAAFAADLTDAVTTLVSWYHNESAPHGRDHCLVVAIHPRDTEKADTEKADTE